MDEENFNDIETNISKKVQASLLTRVRKSTVNCSYEIVHMASLAMPYSRTFIVGLYRKSLIWESFRNLDLLEFVRFKTLLS